MVELLAQAGGNSLAHAGWLIGLALTFGLLMAWSIGANRERLGRLLKYCHRDVG